jgi:hypothetical protein
MENLNRRGRPRLDVVTFRPSFEGRTGLSSAALARVRRYVRAVFHRDGRGIGFWGFLLSSSRARPRSIVSRLLAAAGVVLAAPIALAGPGLPGLPRAVEIAFPELALGVVFFPNGRALSLGGGLGAGATREDGAEGMRIRLVTNRGPSIPCARSDVTVGLTVEEACAGDAAGVILPLQRYTPSIVTLDIEPDGLRFVSTMPIVDRSGRPVTGVPNPLRDAATAIAYTAEGAPIGLNPAGLDPASIAAVTGGQSWIGERHGPSLALIGADGKVIRRIVPRGLEDDLAPADYPVEGLLPAALSRRPFGAGFSGLALSPDGSRLIAAMDRPIPPAAAGRGSGRLVRMLAVDPATGAPLASYAYPLDGPEGGVGELFADAAGALFVLERQAEGFALFRVSLEEARALPPDAEIEEMAVDAPAVLAKTPVARFDGADWRAVGIEAATMLPDGSLMFFNDDGFGVGGLKPTAYVLDGRPLTRQR